MLQCQQLQIRLWYADRCLCVSKFGCLLVLHSTWVCLRSPWRLKKSAVILKLDLFTYLCHKGLAFTFLQLFREKLALMSTSIYVNLSETVFQMIMFVCFCLILFLTSQSTVVMSGRVFQSWISNKQGSMCLAQGHNAVTPVRLHPETSTLPLSHCAPSQMIMEHIRCPCVWDGVS